MRIHYQSALDKEYPYTRIIFNQIDNNSKPFFVATTASETRRFVEHCILTEQLLIQKEIALKHKKLCNSISRKNPKPKSKNINFLFWRHYQSRIRSSTQSLKLCTSSSASNKSLQNIRTTRYLQACNYQSVYCSYWFVGWSQ